jgi:hypothetical protein
MYRHLFLTKDWDMLVVSKEMLGNNDVGLFTYIGLSSFTLRMFNMHGLELPHTILWADSFSVAHNAAHKGKPTISGTAFCCVIQTRIDAV